MLRGGWVPYAALGSCCQSDPLLILSFFQGLIVVSSLLSESSRVARLRSDANVKIKKSYPTRIVSKE